MSNRDREARRLARRLTELQESQDALARATQLSWSTVPVEASGEPVDVPVVELLAAVPVLDGRVEQIEVEAIPFVQATLEQQAEDVDAARVALAETMSVSPAEDAVVVVSSSAPAAEHENALTVWVDSSVPAGGSQPLNVPSVWDGAQWVPAAEGDALRAAASYRAASSGLAGALAAANAAQTAAREAQAHSESVESVTLSAVNIVVGQVGAVADDQEALADRVGTVEGGQTELESRVGTVEAGSASNAAAIGGVSQDVGALEGRVDEQQMYFRFSPTGLTMGVPGVADAAQLHLDNDSITMIQAGEPVSWWEGGVFHVTRAEVEVINIGKHQFERDGSTGTIIRAL